MAKVARAWTATVVVVFGAASAQCSLLPSLDALSGGEGAPDASDEGPRDASPADADAGGGGGDGGRWCASLSPAPMFCDDFDDQGPFKLWTDQYVRANATVSRDGTAFRSAPNAFFANAPASVDPSSAIVYLSTTATKSKLRVAYDMRIDARDPPTGYAEINYIHFGSQFASYLRIHADATQDTSLAIEAYLPDGGIPSHDIAIAGKPRFDGWRRVGIVLDVASTPRTLTITMDGTFAGSQVLEPDLYQPGPVKVDLGIGFTDHPSSSNWSIRYDNVTIDWE
jgi:hypothetical protein